MINLFSITKVISILGIIYAVIIVTILSNSQVVEFQEKILTATKYAIIFELTLVISFVFGWRYVWKLIPKLSDILFPDINGEWDVEIHYIRNNKSEVKRAKAYIKQSFLKISMEVITNESESETLTVQPQKNSESGRFGLFYIFRNTPNSTREPKRLPYIGTAILKSDPAKKSLLEGNYFTDSNTQGTFKIMDKVESK